jgi:hypothetical protein
VVAAIQVMCTKLCFLPFACLNTGGVGRHQHLCCNVQHMLHVLYLCCKPSTCIRLTPLVALRMATCCLIRICVLNFNKLIICLACHCVSG